MKKNKNQALYQALPNSWIAFNDSTTSEYKYTCFVDGWNTVPVSNINEELIKKNIERRINSFKSAGGVVKEDFSHEAISEFKLVTPALKEPFPDILCKMNPLTFYCERCGRAEFYPKATDAPFCRDCDEKGKRIRTKQLQFVYACECGYAEGITLPPGGKEKFFFRADKSQFKFFKQNQQYRATFQPSIIQRQRYIFEEYRNIFCCKD